MVSQSLQAHTRTETFLASATPTVVLDRDFVIQGVNPAYTALTGWPLEELVSACVFDVFPDNPEAPESDGHHVMRRSMEEVVRHARAHHLLVQRYDIPDRTRPGSFLERYWAPVNLPLVADDAVLGIVHRVTSVAEPPAEVVAAIHALREAGGAGILVDATLDDTRIDEIDKAVHELTRVGREVAQLKEALVSRSVIDQAKGLVMADRRCTPDEAFKVLVKLSNDTNVRLSEVAAALVYQAQHPEHG